MVLKILVYLQILVFPLDCTLVHVCVFFAMLDQMDRSWVRGRLFSHVHIQGKFSEMSKYCAHVVDVLIKNTLVMLL
jgi:hypothetical protein